MFSNMADIQSLIFNGLENNYTIMKYGALLCKQQTDTTGALMTSIEIQYNCIA